MVTRALFAVAMSCVCLPAAQASTITFNSVVATETKTWTLSCSDCTMEAFFEPDGAAYSTGTTFDLGGYFAAVGSAFTPVTGNPSSRNPKGEITV